VECARYQQQQQEITQGISKYVAVSGIRCLTFQTVTRNKGNSTNDKQKTKTKNCRKKDIMKT
jgi:hypothetical protein